MDRWTFGLTLLVVGVGGTFITLWVLSLVVDVLKRIFPLREKAPAQQGKT